MSLHPAVEHAAAGDLPPWAVVSGERRRHLERVSALLGAWAAELGLPSEEETRWRAVGFLHDALRDAEPAVLRARVPPPLAGLPAKILHGPAAAERLRVDGVGDGELLRSVAYHTLGHPELRLLGRALYAADFLEPGRGFLDGWRAGLRARMPAEVDGVVRTVLGARIVHLVERGAALRAETVGFWNALRAGG